MKSLLGFDFSYAIKAKGTMRLDDEYEYVIYVWNV